MAKLTILYWRNIPSRGIVRAGRETAKRELPPLFLEAIDAAAIGAGARDDAAYLESWRRGEPIDCGDDLEAEASSAARRLEGDYGASRLAVLVRRGVSRRAVERVRTPTDPMTETVVSAEKQQVVIGSERRFVIIGERINPTGLERLAAATAAGDYSMVVADALAQVETGALMFDVNAGILDRRLSRAAGRGRRRPAPPRGPPCEGRVR